MYPGVQISRDNVRLHKCEFDLSRWLRWREIPGPAVRGTYREIIHACTLNRQAWNKRVFHFYWYLIVHTAVASIRLVLHKLRCVWMHFVCLSNTFFFNVTPVLVTARWINFVYLFFIVIVKLFRFIVCEYSYTWIINKEILFFFFASLPGPNLERKSCKPEIALYRIDNTWQYGPPYFHRDSLAPMWML